MFRTPGVPDNDRCNALQAAGYDVAAVDWSDRTDYIWKIPNESNYSYSTSTADEGFFGRIYGTYDLLRRCISLRPKLLLVYG